MSNEITNTHEIAEQEWDGHSEPTEDVSDIVATQEAEGKGIEFHVSMRNYTMHDMEELIINAAANMLVGRHGQTEIAKLIQERAIEIITRKADEAVAGVTSDILDQPIIPKYPFQKTGEEPVTMREFIGMTGQAYLTAEVDYQGKPTTDNFRARTRVQHLVEEVMDRKFKNEIERTTGTTIRELQKALKQKQDAILAAEKKRVREALERLTEASA